MRRLLLTTSVVFILSLHLNLAGAGPRVIEVEQASAGAARLRNLSRLYFRPVRECRPQGWRRDQPTCSGSQLDVVENVGLSPKVLQFFHTVPIIASEMTCLDEGAGIACYGPISPREAQRVSSSFTTWDRRKSALEQSEFRRPGGGCGHRRHHRASEHVEACRRPRSASRVPPRLPRTS